MDLPEGLDWVRGSQAGRAWLATLPTWLNECAERWSLRVGPPFRQAYASLALPVHLPDGTAAVLKLQYPDEESRYEADALAQWDGDAAIRLLAHDPERRALLLERCQPGTPLHDLPPDRALDVVVGLLPRLWRSAGAPFTPLAQEAAGWIDRMPRAWERAGRPYERRLLDAALELVTGLASSQGEQVLVNQDLHAGNILAADALDAARGPWLAIDPKPLTGEREFSVVPMVRGPELGHSPAAVRHRLHRLSDELGLDRERVRGWTIGHTLSWSVADDTVFPEKIEVVRWLLDTD
ncbi:aminoglycoside phosphotransferase family protein [Micromonospora sp. NBC_00362]|uniref:aminoglycoside phosphotransferase family protein n=1 Tax=unclassified Micromonospora TaxID=2617518 RepID=UPI00225164E3|nr:aminoglycoside phosphotransferase family protein [Micromonospora sp. NBC_00362]MCX5120665.1 aminoglycoside phosphotransferase family protein [Micromonospora sp. NBC_00362]WTI07387.1 aminoglycoside phosphotransferase family protein [Micromonospora sp. NBC_00821]